MEAVRRGGDALGARKLHGFESSGKHVFQQGLLVRGEFSEDVAGHFAGLASTDAELEAREDVVAEVLEDGFNAVVATGGAFFAEAQGAEGEGYVVVDDEHFCERPFVKREDLQDGAAAQVHEGLGLEEDGVRAGELGEVALPFGDGLEGGPAGGGEAVKHHKADVVAGFFILPPRVAEADDEGEGHGGGDRG